MCLIRALKRRRRFIPANLSCAKLASFRLGNLLGKTVVCLGYKFVLWSPLERRVRLSSQVKSDQRSRYD